MKFIIMSDLHGYLPKITCKFDCLLLCGDISPLEFQTNDLLMKLWTDKVFLNWCFDLNCEKVIFIGGNHDFYFSTQEFKKSLPEFIKDHKDHINYIEDKIEYLENNSTIYRGLKIFGCPIVQYMRNWAFSTDHPELDYKVIEDCNILLTHQPPCVKGIGTASYGSYNEREFGSAMLETVISNKNIDYVFCGHIHSGNHRKINILNKENKEITLYNVSIKDDNYIPNYSPLMINIFEK